MTTTSHLQYARALYNLASRDKLEEQLWHELKALNDLFQHKKIEKLMGELVYYPQEIQEKMIDATFKAHVHTYLLHLLKLLALRKKIALLPKIYKSYSHLYHSAKGIDEVVISTARPLEKEEEHALIRQLEEKKKRKVTAHFEIKPELIGGVQMYENGYILDYSVQHYLEQLHRHLLQNKITNQVETGSSLASGQQQSLL